MADKVLPQRVSVLRGLPKSGWPGGGPGVGKEGRVLEVELVKQAIGFLNLQIRELVPESQAYMDLLAFERKLDQTIARKRMEIQEAIKKPLTVYYPKFSQTVFPSWPCFPGMGLGLSNTSHTGCHPSTSRAHTQFRML